MRNEINDVTTKIRVKLDFKDISFANCVWKSQTNYKKYFGCILFCKNGNCAGVVHVIEFARAPRPPHSSSCVGIRGLVLGPFRGIIMKVLTPRTLICHCRGL